MSIRTPVTRSARTRLLNPVLDWARCGKGRANQSGPARSAPLAIQRLCQVSPGWTASQSSSTVRPRRTQARTSDVDARNGGAVNRLKAASRDCSVCGQVAGVGRGE
jgi:hypothetical protein